MHLRTAASAVIGAVLFVLVATANGAGYRYGASDQAFYIPVVMRALNPAAFPRDAPLIDAQGTLMVADEIFAAIMRATGVSLETVFFTAYLLSLALIWTGLSLIGSHVYRNRWLTLTLAAAFTLRHRIPRTSANSFEPYFHPRMLAFGLCLLAVAALLRRRAWLAVALVGVSALIHVTTAMWFAVLIGVALMVLEPLWRRMAIGGGIVLAIAAAALAGGPLGRWRLVTMDDMWLQAVASKDSLFATEWPLWAWAANLGLLVVLRWAHRRRVASGEARDEDTALVWGATALVALFLLTLPLVAWKLALPVQLQISRVFWLVDFVATVYVVALLNRRSARFITTTAALVLALAVGRGAYIMLVERPERSLFAITLPGDRWHDAMRWVAQQPLDTHVLADPGHAWKYGTSVRVSSGRDVFVEEVKDSAIAMYSRDVAVRFVERTAAVGDFGALDVARAQALAAEYELDFLVTEAELPLPAVYRNDQFRIYRLPR